VNRTVIV
jgi:hypothetical protein